KNYLLYKSRESLPELRNNIAVLKKNIENIKAEIIHEIGADSYYLMKKTVAGYEGWVEKVVDNHERQDRQVEQVREAGRIVEERLSGKTLQTFLVLRRYEKNLMLYKDAESYGTFRSTYVSLGIGARPEAARYSALVKDLYRLYREEDEYMDKMRSEAREVQSLTVKLAREERADIAATLDRSRVLLLFALLAILTLGTAVNAALSVSIARPIRELERITRKAATGDFSESIVVEGSDEIASLGTSFNQMEEKLKDALTSLEETVKILMEQKDRLVEAEKLASIGILSAGVAHEINNPLTSVLTFSHLMLEATPEGDPNREKLRMIARETERARVIVRQLLSFAKETPLRLVDIDINQPVTEILESLVEQEKFSQIELVMKLTSGLPRIKADPGKLGQVVLNLLLNAVNAVTPPGSITVSTRAEGGYVLLTVSDTGCGILEENLGHVFEPFYTSWEGVTGTGLGLAVSYGIIKKHGGTINVESVVGQGTTFTVRLPRHG
ncbi:MAG: HAMP domain-containing protein, partial [Nitrospirae bacterium]|nr:HAMP domain-containing protein [Nitrospirota bacterium]